MTQTTVRRLRCRDMGGMGGRGALAMSRRARCCAALGVSGRGLLRTATLTRHLGLGRRRAAWVWR